MKYSHTVIEINGTASGPIWMPPVECEQDFSKRIIYNKYTEARETLWDILRGALQCGDFQWLKIRVAWIHVKNVYTGKRKETIEFGKHVQINPEGTMREFFVS